MASEYLFPDFMDNPEAYDKARGFWHSLCERALIKYGQTDDWGVMPQEITPEGDAPLRDGNPIYSLINHSQLKSVVIIQQDPKLHLKWEMAAWVNIFGDEFSEPGPINEFVFTCNLTQKSVTTFEQLFEAWVQPACQSQDIQQKIKELIRQ
jgi:hypothetical protein